MKRPRNLYLLWHYYSAINILNYILSALIALLSVVVASTTAVKEVDGATTLSVSFRTFIIAMLTGGFLLSLFFFERRRKNQYYFYHNKGYSKYHLIGFAYVINLLTAFLLLLIRIIIF